jgi:signal transduction histidine kinase
MQKLRDLSIRHKLTLLLLGVVGLVLLAVSVANVVSGVQSTRSTMAAKYTALARIVAAQSGAALSIADVDSSGAQQILSDLAVERSILYASLLNSEGKEVVRYPLSAEKRLAPPAALGAEFSSDNFLDVVEEVKLNDGTMVGRFFLRAATDELNAQIRRTITIAVAVFVLALALAYLLSFALQRLFSAPILQLARLTERVSTEHDYSLVAQKHGNDELGSLCDGFNRMMAEILRRDEELQSHRARLEEQVEQRTRVLRDRTEELTASNTELTTSREALQAANKELEAFSYSVSHDLRAPLRAIDGFSRILIQDYIKDLPEDAQEYLRDIRTSTQQMGHLVDDLLAFARLGRQAVKKQMVDFDKMVQQCLHELEGERKDRKVEISVGELPPCPADPALLKQVWTNLLSNAIKYTGQREAARIEIGSAPGEGAESVVYYVKDNGVGFDMRYAHKLFGVFQRLHKAEDYPGTGVGLAIVQRIVLRHGGRIWAESQPNQGTTFRFTLSQGDAVPKEPDHD